MASIILGLLVIFQIIQQVILINDAKIDEINREKVIESIDVFYNNGLKGIENMAKANFQLMSNETKNRMIDFAQQFKYFEIVTEHDAVLIDNALIEHIENIDELVNIKKKLFDYITDIEYWYTKNLENSKLVSISQNRMDNFIVSVLDDSNNLSRISSNILDLVFPYGINAPGQDFFSLYMKYTNFNKNCGNTSVQQHMYYIIMLLVETELKAFVTIRQAYHMRYLSNYDNNTMRQLQILSKESRERLFMYLNTGAESSSILSRDVSVCGMANPKIGENVIELEGLFQVTIRHEIKMNRVLGDDSTGASKYCEDIKSKDRDRFFVYDCKTSKPIESCDTRNSPHVRRLSWWKTESETYGHKTPCKYGIESMSGYHVGWFYNDLCICSVNFTNNPQLIRDSIDGSIYFQTPKIMKISTEPQLSDIANNMFVVGVQFYVKNDTIHLQIKQHQLGRNKDRFQGKWKPVDVDNKQKKKKINSEYLFDKRNILYLDDINVHPNHVVTGVGFQLTKDGKGFELNVHSTEYDYDKGQLGTSTNWQGPGDFSNSIDYNRTRKEIRLNDSDSLSTTYGTDPQTNKFIQFQLSSIKKDAGYHTIPFFDARPVEMVPKFPLSGIGLFHRSRDGFGGYITPRLFTQSIGKALEISLNSWAQLYKYENKTVEIKKKRNCTPTTTKMPQYIKKMQSLV